MEGEDVTPTSGILVAWLGRPAWSDRDEAVASVSGREGFPESGHRRDRPNS